MAEYIGVEQHVWAWIVGGLFAFAACIVYFFHVRQHLSVPHSKLRKHVLRILTMVPIYAVSIYSYSRNIYDALASYFLYWISYSNYL